MWLVTMTTKLRRGTRAKPFVKQRNEPLSCEVIARDENASIVVDLIHFRFTQTGSRNLERAFVLPSVVGLCQRGGGRTTFDSRSTLSNCEAADQVPNVKLKTQQM